MNTQEIKRKYFHITCSEAVYLIKLNSVNRIAFVPRIRTDGVSYVAALAASDSHSVSKSCKVIKGDIFKTRNPHVLAPYVGNSVRVYTERLEKEGDELFRIVPIKFSIGKGGLKKNPPQNPYLTKSGIFVLPHAYINRKIDESISLSRVSFNRMGSHMLKRGEIICEIMVSAEFKEWNYPLYKRTNGVTTKPMLAFNKFVKENNKRIEHFKYFNTEYGNSNKFGLIVFKEL